MRRFRVHVLRMHAGPLDRRVYHSLRLLRRLMPRPGEFIKL